MDPEAPDGILIYLKPSLSGDEPVDVLEYAARQTQFTHEPTSDQVFNESQFESYRRLGAHVAGEMFASETRNQAALQTVFDALHAQRSTARSAPDPFE